MSEFVRKMSEVVQKETPRFEWKWYDRQELYYVTSCDGQHFPGTTVINNKYCEFVRCSKDQDDKYEGCDGRLEIYYELTDIYWNLIKNLVAVITLAAAEQKGFVEGIRLYKEISSNIL